MGFVKDTEKAGIYENLIKRINEKLPEVYDRLWIYDLKGALSIIDDVIRTVDSELRTLGLDSLSLIHKARSLKREKRLEEVPGHEITVLAPLLAKLIRIQKNIKNIMYDLGARTEEVVLPLQRRENCNAFYIDEIYLIGCLVSPLPSCFDNTECVKFFIKQAVESLKPKYSEPPVITNNGFEMKLWFSEMVMYITLLNRRCEIKILVSSRMQSKLKYEVSEKIGVCMVLFELLS